MGPVLQHHCFCDRNLYQLSHEEEEAASIEEEGRLIIIAMRWRVLTWIMFLV